MPQSITPTRPSRRRSRLPACTSPWKNPQRTVVIRNPLTVWDTTGAGSNPYSAMRDMSSTGTPSRNSIVNTRAALNAG